MAESSELEDLFACHWQRDHPELPPVREFTLEVWELWSVWGKIQRPEKRQPYLFRADFAWPAARVAVEIQGGQFAPSKHNSVRGLERDAIKSVLAQASGWVLIPLPTTLLTRPTAPWLGVLADLITSRSNDTRTFAAEMDHPHGSWRELGDQFCALWAKRHQKGAQRAAARAIALDLRGSLDAIRTAGG